MNVVNVIRYQRLEQQFHRYRHAIDYAYTRETRAIYIIHVIAAVWQLYDVPSVCSFFSFSSSISFCSCCRDSIWDFNRLKSLLSSANIASYSSALIVAGSIFGPYFPDVNVCKYKTNDIRKVTSRSRAANDRTRQLHDKCTCYTYIKILTKLYDNIGI